MTPPVRRARRAVLLAHASLLVTTVAWTVTTQPAAAAWVLTPLAALPLLLPWYGLLCAHRFTHIWATLCVMPYLVMGVMEAIASPAARVWAGACVALALTFFAALIHYLKVTRPVHSA